MQQRYQGRVEGTFHEVIQYDSHFGLYIDCVIQERRMSAGWLFNQHGRLTKIDIQPRDKVNFPPLDILQVEPSAVNSAYNCATAALKKIPTLAAQLMFQPNVTKLERQMEILVPRGHERVGSLYEWLHKTSRPPQPPSESTQPLLHDILANAPLVENMKRVNGLVPCIITARGETLELEYHMRKFK